MHIPVLLDEVCKLFSNEIPESKTLKIPKNSLQENNVIIDCTLGLAGHTKALLEANKSLQIIGIDKDNQAINLAKENLKEFQNRIKIIQGGFKEKLQEAINLAKESNQKIIGILADIGVSSLQLDTLARGFSFKSPNLDMRMDVSQNLDASYVLSSYSEFELERIFREFGEIRESKKLASLIKSKKGGFESAKELSDFISLHHKSGKIHPATLVFQALRIEVNDELGELKGLLDSILRNKENLSSAIIALISFHSLEDRIIKGYFKQWSRDCICDESAYRCECGANHSNGKILTKKPILPTKQEITTNPRARSAKLRAFKFKDF